MQGCNSWKLMKCEKSMSSGVYHIKDTNDVVMLASWSQNLQCVLGRFATEYKAAGMRIRSSNFKAMDQSQLEKDILPSPGPWRDFWGLSHQWGKHAAPDRHMNWCGNCNDAFVDVVPVCHGEEVANPKTMHLFYLLINQWWGQDHRGHELWIVTEMRRSRI